MFDYQITQMITIAQNVIGMMAHLSQYKMVFILSLTNVIINPFKSALDGFDFIPTTDDINVVHRKNVHTVVMIILNKKHWQATIC